MSLKQYATIFSVAITTMVVVEADDVYKNVDAKGAVEFSDRPSAGAETVNVNPNVVDVAPVKPIKPSPPVSTGAADGPDSSEQPDPVPENVGSGYHGDIDNRSEKRRKLKERIEQGGKPTTLPANIHPGKATARGGGHRR